MTTINGRIENVVYRGQFDIICTSTFNYADVCTRSSQCCVRIA